MSTDQNDLTNSAPKLELNKPYFWIATWFGCGLMRPAPGTWGSIGALPFAIILFGVFGLYGFLAAIVFITYIGFRATQKFEAATASHDNKMIVVDEVVGQWIALIPVFALVGVHAILIILAFVFFRLFDILKPWPASHFDQNVGGAMGVIGDDVIAGIFAAGCVLGVIYAGFS